MKTFKYFQKLKLLFFLVLFMYSKMDKFDRIFRTLWDRLDFSSVSWSAQISDYVCNCSKTCWKPPVVISKYTELNMLAPSIILVRIYGHTITNYDYRWRWHVQFVIFADGYRKVFKRFLPYSLIFWFQRKCFFCYCYFNRKSNTQARFYGYHRWAFETSESRLVKAVFSRCFHWQW